LKAKRHNLPKIKAVSDQETISWAEKSFGCRRDFWQFDSWRHRTANCSAGEIRSYWNMPW